MSNLNVGDFARNVESHWLGRIERFEIDGNGDQMAVMIGVDTLAVAIMGVPFDQALCSDDIQWHAPADLVPAPHDRR